MPITSLFYTTHCLKMKVAVKFVHELIQRGKSGPSHTFCFGRITPTSSIRTLCMTTSMAVVYEWFDVVRRAFGFSHSHEKWGENPDAAL